MATWAMNRSAVAPCQRSVRLDIDDITGPDLLDLPAASGDESDAVGDVQRLALRVCVPCGPCAGGEAKVGAPDRGLGIRVADAVDVDGAREPILRPTAVYPLLFVTGAPLKP